jgi:hypothetical protein
MNGFQLSRHRMGGLWLPDTTLNYASTPDTAALDIVGDIDLRCRASLRAIDNTGGNASTFIAKYGSAGQRSYYFVILSGGRLQFVWTEDGSTVKSIGGTASESATHLNIDTPYWWRVTFDVDNGSSGHTARFYTSVDGVTWDQIGGDVTGSGATSIFNSTAIVEVGSRGTGSGTFNGTIYAAEIRDGIGGTVVAAPEFLAPVNAWTTPGATRWDGYRVWTITGSRWEWR